MTGSVLMRAALTAALATLVLAVIPVGASAEELSWTLRPENVQPYVEQQSMEPGGPEKLQVGCEGPWCVVNPTGCVWTVDNWWETVVGGGELQAGKESVSTMCVIDDWYFFEEPAKPKRGGETHYVHLFFRTQASRRPVPITVRLKESFTLKTATVPGTEHEAPRRRAYLEYHTCFAVPKAGFGLEGFQEIPESKGYTNKGVLSTLGGFGHRVDYELKVTSPTTQPILGEWYINQLYGTESCLTI